jgi:hypothetical protein
MDSMILPQVHLTIPAEGLKVTPCRACTLFYYQQPSELSGLAFLSDYFSVGADYILSPQQFVPLDPLI